MYAIARKTLAFAAAAGFVGIVAMGTVRAQDVHQAAEATYKDIEATLGLVPGFFKAFPEAGIPGAWEEFKHVQGSDKTALPPKVKQLIGLAVSAQVPCAYCIYFHTAVAKAYGASDEEVKEAVALAAISRHWSTVLNGMQVDLPTFKKEIDTSLAMAAKKSN